MGRRTKAFDCVQMKREVQERIPAEWERRKAELSSYGEFLEPGLKESEWGRRMWHKLPRRGSPSE
jgi:hypothetical protein